MTIPNIGSQEWAWFSKWRYLLSLLLFYKINMNLKMTLKCRMLNKKLNLPKPNVNYLRALKDSILWGQHESENDFEVPSSLKCGLVGSVAICQVFHLFPSFFWQAKKCWLNLFSNKQVFSTKLKFKIFFQ